MKHTKGPWEITKGKTYKKTDYSVYQEEVRKDYLIRLGGTSNDIARLTYIGSLNKKEDDNIKALGGFDIKTTEANAHLIAAAPELLEACNMILKRFGGSVKEYEEMTAGQKRAIEMTAEAIRKTNI